MPCTSPSKSPVWPTNTALCSCWTPCSSLAGAELRTDDWDIDLAVSCNHKAIGAPIGHAHVVVGERAWEAMEARSTPCGSVFSNLKIWKSQVVPSSSNGRAKKRAYGVFPAVHLFYAMHEAFTSVLEEGLESRFERHLLNAEAFREGITGLGLKPLAHPDVASPTVTCVRLPEGISSNEFLYHFRHDHGLFTLPGLGRVRGYCRSHRPHGCHRHATQYSAHPARFRQHFVPLGTSPRPRRRPRQGRGDLSGGGTGGPGDSVGESALAQRERFPVGPFYKASLSSYSVGALCELLHSGRIVQHGLIPWGSNYTFLVTMEVQQPHLMLAVYKPRRGEAPLWDFPNGTLYRRERAAFVLSEALGWGLVPPTIIRQGPNGVGSFAVIRPPRRRGRRLLLPPRRA